MQICCDHQDKSINRLSPCKVITLILTIFPVLYTTSPWLIYNQKFVLLIPLHLFYPSPSPVNILLIRTVRREMSVLRVGVEGGRECRGGRVHSDWGGWNDILARPSKEVEF